MITASAWTAERGMDAEGVGCWWARYVHCLCGLNTCWLKVTGVRGWVAARGRVGGLVFPEYLLGTQLILVKCPLGGPKLSAWDCAHLATRQKAPNGVLALHPWSWVWIILQSFPQLNTQGLIKHCNVVCCCVGCARLPGELMEIIDV